MPNTVLRDILSKTARGMGWLSLAAAGPLLSRVITLVVIARLVSPESFGIYAALLVAVGIADLIGQFGVGTALVQLRSIEPGHETAALVISIALGLTMAAFIAICSPWLVHQLGVPDGAAPLRVLSLAFPFAAGGSVSTALLQRDLDFRRIAAGEVAAHLVGYVLVGIGLAAAGFEVWALVGAFMARTVLQALFMLAFRRPCIARFRWDQAVEIVTYGGGLTIARFANYVALQGDKLVVARRLGTLGLGFYGRAYEIMALPASLLGQVVDRVTFPVLARVQDDREQLSAFLLLTTRWGFGVLAPISLVVAAFADTITHILLGPDWAPAADPLAVLALALAFRAVSKIPDSLLRAVGLVYRRAVVQWIYAVLVVVGSLIGARDGITGVATSVSLAIFLHYVMLMSMAGHHTHTPVGKFVAAHGVGVGLAGAVGLLLWMT